MRKERNTKKIILFGILLVFLLVGGWHLFLLLTGIMIGAAAGFWGIAVSTVALFCIANMLLFILKGLGTLLIICLALFWGVLTIIFFPILFPLVVPLLILMGIINLLRRKSTPER